MPTVDETGNKIAPYSGVQGVHVLKVAAERKHDAISKVLQVLTNDSVGIAMAKASGCAPAKQSCYDDPAISGDDMVMAMYDMAQDAVPMPNVPEMDVMWTVTENLLVNVNMSGKDVRSSAQAAQEQAESLIKQMQCPLVAFDLADRCIPNPVHSVHLLYKHERLPLVQLLVCRAEEL